MGGVYLADQMSGLYEYDRKSDKWWQKVFSRLIMMSAVNAWFIHCELNRKKGPFKKFLVTLAETLIEEGLLTTAVRRSMKLGRRSQKTQSTNHPPVEENTALYHDIVNLLKIVSELSLKEYIYINMP